MVDAQPYFRIPELARIWRCRRSTILRWIDQGQLPATDMAVTRGKRRHLRVSKEDAAAFVQARRAGQPQPHRRRRRRQRTPVVTQFIT